MGAGRPARRAASRVSEVARIAITAIAAGGAGVGRLDGMAVFVPRTAPGDEVEVTLRRHRRHGEGRLRRLVAGGPARIEPRCLHYTKDACGGCQLQHLPLDEQRRAKREIVVQALRRLGGREAEVEPVVPSPADWGYRRKLTMTLRQVRGAWIGGLRGYDDPDAVFDLTECHIVDPAIVAAWHEVRAVLGLLPSVGECRAVFVRTEQGVALNLVGLPGDWPQAAAFVSRCPSLVAARTEGPDGVRGIAGAAEATGAFVQVNAAMAALVQAHVLSLLGAVQGSDVVDAYGGQGDLALALSELGARVTLIELDPEATSQATRRLQGRAQVVTARVESALPDALPADIVVLNPPRTGVDARVCQALEAGGASTLVYVSCDPATLARDLGRLPSWQLRRVTPFDMFPQTAHVETVCLLTRTPA